MTNPRLILPPSVCTVDTPEKQSLGGCPRPWILRQRSRRHRVGGHGASPIPPRWLCPTICPFLQHSSALGTRTPHPTQQHHPFPARFSSPQSLPLPQTWLKKNSEAQEHGERGQGDAGTRLPQCGDGGGCWIQPRGGVSKHQARQGGRAGLDAGCCAAPKKDHLVCTLHGAQPRSAAHVPPSPPMYPQSPPLYPPMP